MVSDALVNEIKGTCGATVAIARALNLTHGTVSQWRAVPVKHRKAVAAALRNFVPKREKQTAPMDSNAAWPGALIDKECARLKALPCAPWPDIIRLDRAIAVARHSGAPK